MKFDPKSEEEINAANLLTGGDYDFEVAASEEGVSKAGNDMVKLTLHIMDDDDRKHVVFDYLVAGDSSAFKLRGFADSVGLLGQYEKGEIRAETMQGRAGKCTIGIDDKNKAYAPKNVVRAYLRASDAPKVNGTAKKPAADLDDAEIPF